MRFFILVYIRRHFKACAFGHVKCHVQMLCNSMREGPDNYFDNVHNAFRKDKRCDQTSKFITLPEKSFSNPDTKISVFMEKEL